MKFWTTFILPGCCYRFLLEAFFPFHVNRVIFFFFSPLLEQQSLDLPLTAQLAAQPAILLVWL